MTFWHFDASSNSVVGGHYVKVPVLYLEKNHMFNCFQHQPIQAPLTSPENIFCKDTLIAQSSHCVSMNPKEMHYFPLETKDSFWYKGILEI